MDKKQLSARDIAVIGLMVAVIEVSKFVLSGLPNIELTSFWIIMFSIFAGKKIYYAIPVFILVEGAVYGFGLWWIMYLYAWPLLVIIASFLKKSRSPLAWAIVSGLFGLCFGLLCSIPYFFIGAAGGTIANGFSYAFAWWVAGIPWDIIHGISNFVLMLLLFKPVGNALERFRI